MIRAPSVSHWTVFLFACLFFACGEKVQQVGADAGPERNGTGPTSSSICGEAPPVLGEWICVGPGTFEHEKGRCSGDTGAFITLTRPFWMMRDEVRMAQWRELMPEYDYEEWLGTNLTVATWPGAILFANRASVAAGLEPCYPEELLIGCGRSEVDASVGWFEFNCLEPPELPANLDCEGFRIPLEAEWEWVVSEGGTIDSREEYLIRESRLGFVSISADDGEFLFDRFPSGEGARPEPYPPGSYIDPVRHEAVDADRWVYRTSRALTNLDPRDFCDDHYFKPEAAAVREFAFRLVQSAQP